MLLCQHHEQVQPQMNLQENVDWTRSSQFYGNLGEIPSFLSTHRQLGIQTSQSNANTHLLQGKQLQVFNMVKHHLESKSSPLYMIFAGTAGTG